MSEADTHTAPTENLEPFTGDRGWKTLERSEGELFVFLAVVVILLVTVLAVATMGVAGLGLVFVLLTFVTLAALVVISVGG